MPSPTSTTTSVEAARGFAGEGGVVIKIDVASGKDICALSFFATEAEVLLSPNHKFVVTSETGGAIDDAGFATIEMLQLEGDFARRQSGDAAADDKEAEQTRRARDEGESRTLRRSARGYTKR